MYLHRVNRVYVIRVPSSNRSISNVGSEAIDWRPERARNIQRKFSILKFHAIQKIYNVNCTRIRDPSIETGLVLVVFAIVIRFFDYRADLPTIRFYLISLYVAVNKIDQTNIGMTRVVYCAKKCESIEEIRIAQNNPADTVA